MFTIDKRYTFEQTINKSRFIASIYPVKTIDEIKEILNNTKKEHYDSNHNCYSYILGERAETAKNSDDGEPSQTAGVVIYEVLRKNELTNVLAVVTRYFGGIKLGAGGLIRAYASTVSNALKEANLKKITSCTIIEVSFAYPLMKVVEKIISEEEIINKKFLDEISIEFLIVDSKKEEIINKLISQTKNEINIKILKNITKAL